MISGSHNTWSRAGAATAASPSRPILNSMQDIVWLLLVILAPLWVNLWGEQPFDFSKVMLVRTLVWLLAGLTVVETVHGRLTTRRPMPGQPLLGPLGLLALVIVATTATSVNWRLSLWGSYERSQGAVTVLTYVLLCLLAARHFRRVEQARPVLKAMVMTGAPLVLFSLLQTLGWNPFGLVTDARSPVYATLGRANFVGAWLAMLAPLSLALLLTGGSRRERVLWSLLLVGSLAGIGLTLARSAGLAALVSLGLFALLWWGACLTRFWRRLAWCGMGMLFLAGPLAVLWLGQQETGSTAARLAIWEGAWTLITRRPLLGYGSDALGLVFPAVYAPELVYYQGREVFVDRAHNLLLDWAVMSGLPGLLAVLVAVGTFAMVVLGAVNRGQPSQRRALLIAVLAAVLGNFANNLTSFDVAPTATAGWLLIGMGVALASSPHSQDPEAQEPEAQEPESEESMTRPMVWRWAVSALVLAAIGTAVWQANARPLMADMAARRAAGHAERGEWNQAVSASELAVAYWPDEPVHHLSASRYTWRQAVEDPSTAQSRLPQAESALHSAQELRPGDPGIWLRTAQFYASAAQEFGSDTWDRAEAAYRRTGSLAPNHATVFTSWGRDALAQGDPDAAATALRRAVALDASSGEAYLYLGAAELALGRTEIALGDYREAVRLSPTSSDAYAGLARCYWQLGRREEALQAVDRALQLAPRRADLHSLRHAIIQSSGG